VYLIDACLVLNLIYKQQIGYSGYMQKMYKARFSASAMATSSIIRSPLGAVFYLFTIQSKIL
jgi:hypothetical protein